MNVILVLIVFLVLGIAAFLSTVRRGALTRAADTSEQMDADSRSLFSPIRRLVGEIEEIAAKQDSMAIRIVGGEAIREAQRIREQCAQALVARTELKKAGRGKSLAEKEIEDLTQKAAEATSDSERTALENAREARKLELTHYQTVAETMARIDGGIRQAEAALSEMKTRLAVSASSEKASAAGDEDLRETIARMKSLSVSYDEAEQAINS